MPPKSGTVTGPTRTDGQKSGLAGGATDGMAGRRAAVAILHAVLAGRKPLDDVLARHAAAGPMASMAQRDRAFVRAIVATTLRRLGQLDHVLGRFLEKPLPAGRGQLREILLSAAAQLLFLGTPPHAVVSLAVAQTQQDKHARRFDKLANAVLRRVASQGRDIVVGQDAAKLNTPEWLWASWSSAYGEARARAIAVSHLSEAALDISVKSQPEHWAAVLGGDVLPTGSIRFKPDGRIENLPGYKDGAWWVQDAAAALPARLLGTVAGKRIADLCAAPGGKTAALAACGALVTAVDQSVERIGRLKQNLARLRLDADIVTADVTDWQPLELFDAVLLDAPCTATGTIRRHPDIPYLKRPSDVATLAGVQARLLQRALSLVKPGGTVIYSTCSLEAEEGPGQIAQLLAAMPRIRVDPIAADEIGAEPDWITAQGFLRTLPCYMVRGAPDNSGLDGFFAARLIRPV